MRQEVDVLVIGAGQAGLAMGYYLTKHSLNHVLVDAGAEIGEVWRKRYDSLVLFTPRRYSSLPGLSFPGDPEGLPTKEDVADYLAAYAARYSLPVALQTKVERLERTEQGFTAVTNRGVYQAKQVVVATGPFQKPFIPPVQGTLSAEVFQLHSAHFRSPADLPEGSVLVVGGGNTGVQLAIELAQARDVYLSLGETRRYWPLHVLNKSIFWWFDKLGILHAPITTRVGRWLSKQKDPVFGLGPELQQLVRQGKIRLVPKVEAFAGREVRLRDNSSVNPDNILWCTGFVNDYSWINIPGALDEQGKVIHQRGVSPVAGLYFLGLPWQHCRNSALLGGVGQDAAFLAQQIRAWRDSRSAG